MKTMHYKLDSTRQWLQPARRVASPNCDERPDAGDIDLLVLHGISLPPGEFGGDYVEQLFSNRLDPQAHPYFDKLRDMRVSAHLFIDRGGAVTQFVPLLKRAWHAGESSFCGRDACNDYSIGIELEGTDETPYAAAQYETLRAVIVILRQAWPAIGQDRIVGHADIAPGRKTDPGPAFDWTELGLAPPGGAERS
ncbi:MAG: 1,6-anhydro-N-acetylmuramyl-L-alanine amidase AmpD [Gammaproteobacteria bacterium]